MKNDSFTEGYNDKTGKVKFWIYVVPCLTGQETPLLHAEESGKGNGTFENNSLN